MRIRFLPATILAAIGFLVQPTPADATEFLSGSEVRALLDGSCVTGEMDDGRDYEQSWNGPESVWASQGKKNRSRWHDYDGSWTVSDSGVYQSTFKWGTNYYRVSQKGDTVTWVKVDESGREVGETFTSKLGGCSHV